MRKRQAFILFLILGLSLAPFGCKEKQPAVTYPVTAKGEVVDDYFGTMVADPYRWLEDDKAENVGKWVEAQNAVTFGYLEQIPFRDKIRARLTEIYNYPRKGWRASRKSFSTRTHSPLTGRPGLS
jgi:prolyl oligopeptidase